MLRRWCRLVVEWFGPSWSKVGWILFLFRLWVPKLFMHSPYYSQVVGLLNALLCFWWLIDATRHCGSKTVVKLGVLMILSCFMLHYSPPIILLWLFYWVYLRD